MGRATARRLPEAQGAPRRHRLTAPTSPLDHQQPLPATAAITAARTTSRSASEATTEPSAPPATTRSAPPRRTHHRSQTQIQLVPHPHPPTARSGLGGAVATTARRRVTRAVDVRVVVPARIQRRGLPAAAAQRLGDTVGHFPLPAR